tara:strand:+ start:1638 stop:1742 length:105 start_codon:yes stop_codon:yes gene_type:complete
VKDDDKVAIMEIIIAIMFPIIVIAFAVMLSMAIV